MSKKPISLEIISRVEQLTALKKYSQRQIKDLVKRSQSVVSNIQKGYYSTGKFSKPKAARNLEFFEHDPYYNFNGRQRDYNK